LPGFFGELDGSRSLVTEEEGKSSQHFAIAALQRPKFVRFDVFTVDT
jgi:hypothetical protein